MAALGRQSSFLPTIKCSSCGDQIEISMMGEHVCKTSTKSSSGTSPPEAFDNFKPWNKAVHEKIGRVPPPPKVDTLAANRTYYRAGQLTPVSNSSGSASRSASPLTPNARSGPGGRSDDYFAPKIASEYDSTPPQSRRAGGGGYGGLDGFDDQLYPAASPKKQAPSLLQRMNTIAPGPFELNRRPGARNNAFPSRGNSQDDGSSLDGSAPPSLSNSYGTLERPRTANSNASFGSSGQQPPRLPRKNNYSGFGPPQRGGDDFEPEPLNASNRAGTFPRPSEPADPPLRTPSAPGMRPDRMRRPSNNLPPPVMNGERSRRPSNDIMARPPLPPPMGDDRTRRPSLAPDTSRPPPPRKSIVSRPQTRDGGGGGNMPEINLAVEFGIGNPYHSPNPSMSSSTSSSSGLASQRSAGSISQGVPSTQPSYESSPARSLRSRGGPRPPMRNPSAGSNKGGGSRFDDVMADLQSSMEDLGSSASSRRNDRDRDLPAAPPQPPPFDKKSGSLRSLRSNNNDRGRSRDALDRGRTGGDSSYSYSNRYGSPDRDRTRGTSRARSRGREPPNSATTASRGICKACGDPISGKSISSADGRLTGRYHKACFKCATCGDFFSGSTFYVHDDRPYCERDWHKANRSLCGSCDNGIEGQYLADEDDKKYHPDCFTCADCGTVLRDGYFDVGGKQYCERDAWRRTQQQMQMQQQPWLAAGGAGAGAGAGNNNLGVPGQRTMSTMSGISVTSNGSRRGMPLAASGLPGGPKAGAFPPSGLRPVGPASAPGPGPGPGGMLAAAPGGLPGGRPFGLPSGNRLGPRPRMEKRMTRLGMM